MLIYVKCLTYEYKGKKDQLISVKSTDTISSFREKVMKKFNIDENKDIYMFEDKTERMLNCECEDYQYIISDYFSNDNFQSLSFSE
jgi:hypothetical protein